MFFGLKPYIALIGDMKKSRKLEDRKEIQIKLDAVLDNINYKYESDISAKFVITLGDEFQGLISRGVVVIDIIEEIQRKMYPVQIRFGLGIGEITTEINSEMAIGADGPAYHMARKAIEWLKHSEQQNKTQPSDIRIEVDEDTNSICDMLNTIFILMDVIKTNWSVRQREIIYEFEKYGRGQKECAKRLNISQSSVHRSLINGNYYAYQYAKDTVERVLQEIGEKHV